MTLNFNKILVIFIFLVTSIPGSAQLNTDFTANITEGCGSLSRVQFTPTGNASITSWSWSFGNGNTSPLQNPSASYTSTGRYTVTLVVSNGTLTQTITKNNYISVYRNPSANFTFTPTGGCSPLPVIFSSTSTLGDGPIVNYNWDFKDGSQAADTAKVNHTYQVQGSFSPSLQITDTNGCTSSILLGPVNVTPSPIAAFSAPTPRTSCSDSLTVDFIDGSSGVNLTYFWEFGDGANSNQQNPTHTYIGYGGYTVSLTVSDPNCSNKKTAGNYIRLRQPLANFSLTDSIFCVGQLLPLTNTSSDVDTYLWDFGDGTGSTVRLPKKSYSDSGNYIIKLTVFAPGCSDFISDTVRIQKIIADFSVIDTFSCNKGDSVRFIDQSYNAVQWQWRIGLTKTTRNTQLFAKDTVQNPVHYYANTEGRYSDSLMVTSPGGCMDTLFKASHRVFDTTLIYITDDNNAIYGPPVTGCFPKTVELNSFISAPIQTSNYVFTWTLIDSSTYIGPNPPQDLTIINDSVRTVKLSVLSADGCKASSSLEIRLGYKIPPVVNFFPTTVCYADSFFIANINPNDTVPNFIAYIIKSLSGNTRDSISSVKITDTVAFTLFRDTGYHSLQIRQGYNGCDSVLFIDSAFYVNGPVVQTVFSSDCINRNLVNFKATATGATRFSWDFGDSTARDTTSLTPSHRYDSLNTYEYIFTAYNDTNGCAPVADTQFVALGIISTPIIRPDYPNFCLGEESLIWQNSLTTLDSLRWFIDGQLVSEEDSFRYTFNQRGSYQISYKGKDLVGCEYERTKDYYISKPQASFSYNLLSNCLPVDINMINTSVFDTTVAKNYFLMGGNDTLFAPNNIYTYTTGGTKTISLYTENQLGCSDTVIASNLFNIIPLDVAIRTISNRNICQGRTILFRNISVDRNHTFAWDFGDGFSLQSNQDSVYHTFDSAGVFNVKLRGENANACIKFDSVLFTIEANPVAGFTADTMISSCYPLEVQFQDTSKGNIVKWFWQIGSNFSVLDTPRFIFENVGMFDVSLSVETANGCTDNVFKSQYIQTNGPEASFSLDKNTGCVNEPFTFALDSLKNVGSYVWDFGDGNTKSGGTVATHSYKTVGKIYVSLILSDATGACSVSIRDSVQIFNVLADFTMASDTGCAPFSSTFISTSLNATGLSWDFGQGEGFSATQSQETIQFGTPGEYIIRLAITSSIGCVDTAIKSLVVFEKPLAVVSGDTGICIGQSVQLSASGGDLYLWSPDTFITNNTISNPVVNPKINTRYSVKVSNVSTCFDTASIWVEVIQEPTPFSLIDSSIIIGENYQLNAHVGNGYNYSWTPSHGLGCSNCSNPLAMPLQTTIYYLVVSDKYGCFTVRDTMKIEVVEKYSLDVPKAFSPNNDGINDVIFAKGWGLKELIAFKIYNRFGELVFESTDFTEGWNGVYKGKNQNIETYIYTVEALTFGNKVLTKTGNISLLR